jgi:hypothetical protein
MGLMGLMGLMGCAAAQNGFNMPYSQFGLGFSDLPYTVPTVNRMGGVAYTVSGSNCINPFNPASYGSIGMESFVFDMGANIQLTRLQNNAEHANDADGNISHLMFGLPITKWWKAAAGLLPYSTVDYASVWESTYLNNSVVKNIYDGTGGVSIATLGSAFNILGDGPEGRRLQAGFNINYLTGRIQRAISYSFQGVDSTHYMDSRRFKETKVGSVVFDLGVQYWEPLGEKYTLGLGLTYKPYREMNTTDKALIYTYHTSDQSLIDTIFPAAGQSPEFSSSLKLDHTFGIGLSLERNNRWLVAADATFAGWSGLYYKEGMNPSILGDNFLTTGPYSRYALGFEKIGVMDASTYWGRISWSAGFHTEQGTMRLILNGREEVVNEWGFGLGATLPMRKGRSLLTLSVNYSSLGSKDLLQRNVLTFGIAVSSCERWFVKRRYN